LYELDQVINTKASRIDLDINKFMVYCDNFKNSNVKDLFEIPERDLDLLKNDNIGKTDFDVLIFGENGEQYHKSLADL
jgi:hypothetical protein